METPNLRTSPAGAASVKGILAILFALSLLQFAADAFAEDRQTLHTPTAEVTSRLRRLARLPANNRLRLAIGLPLRHNAALATLLQDLYNPASAKYRQYLTPAQFAGQFGPTEQDYQKVVNFAETSGLVVEETFGNRAVLDVSGAVSVIEKAFHVTLGAYQHPTENREFYGPDVEPTVDAGLPMLSISGLDNYIVPRPSGFGSTPVDGGTMPTPNGGSAGGLYAGTDFSNAYFPNTPLTGVGQTVGLVEFDGYTPGDIQQYETVVGLPSVPLVNVLKDGVTNIAGPNNGEVALDIEMPIAVAPGLAQVNVYEGTSDVNIMNEIASPTQGETLPQQVSCSWGIGGDPAILQAVLELAAQGQSFFYASGDGGAYPTSTSSGNLNQNYITIVGGSSLVMNGVGASWNSESVWNNPGEAYSGKYASSGGILINVNIPFYQQGVDMSLNHGSTQWRNVPDVAMVADNILTYATSLPTNGPPVTGVRYFTWGTSAAAPLWAGFTALVNQQAAAQGKPTVGFLNPSLYDIAKGSLYASCFHDITNGNNIPTNGSNLYYAAAGYDLCTGWGTPKGAPLINALAGFSGPVFVDFNYTSFLQNGSYPYPFNTLAAGINAVSASGTIIIETAGSSSETMTISKPLTITADDGPDTLGH